MRFLNRIFLNELVIIGAIIINSVILFLMGFRTYAAVGFLDCVDSFFTLFFLSEVIVKTVNMGWKNYIGNSWNKFDFFLVVISVPSLAEFFIEIPDLSYLLVFRLLRVLRMLRFMRFIPNITKMIAGIQRAFRASAFVFAALFIYNVLLAVLSTYLFRDMAPDLFGNPMLSLYSIFQIFTLEGWNEIPSIVIANAGPDSWIPGFARLYFIIVVITGGIFGISIVNAIFVDEMIMDNTDDLEDKVDRLDQKVDSILDELKNR